MAWHGEFRFNDVEFSFTAQTAGGIGFVFSLIHTSPTITTGNS